MLKIIISFPVGVRVSRKSRLRQSPYDSTVWDTDPHYDTIVIPHKAVARQGLWLITLAVFLNLLRQECVLSQLVSTSQTGQQTPQYVSFAISVTSAKFASYDTTIKMVETSVQQT